MAREPSVSVHEWAVQAKNESAKGTKLQYEVEDLPEDILGDGHIVSSDAGPSAEGVGNVYRAICQADGVVYIQRHIMVFA